MSARKKLVDFDSEDDVAERRVVRLPKDTKDNEEFELQDEPSSSNGSMAEGSSDSEEEAVRPAAGRRSKRSASVAARGKVRQAIQASNYNLDSSSDNEEDQSSKPVIRTPNAPKKRESTSPPSSQRRSSSRIHAVSAKKQARIHSKFDGLVAARNEQSLKEEKQRRKRQRVINDDDSEDDDAEEEYQASDASSGHASPVLTPRHRRGSAIKEARPEKEENDFYDDDIENFIVEDDEDEEEEDGEEGGGRGENDSSDGDDEDGEHEFEGPTKQPSKSTRKANGHRSRRVVDDEEEDDEDSAKVARVAEEDQVYMRKSKKKKARKRHRTIRDSDDDDDEGAEDIDDERPLSGPALYAFVDNLREEEELELARDSSGGGTLTQEQAFELYLELLARAHVEPDFVSNLHRNPRSRENIKYTKARDVIEREICTVRESVFASMAWTKDFYEQMTTQGFYRFWILNRNDRREAYCGACGRSKHVPSVNICLSGEEYNANRLWTSGRWHEELPEGTLLYTREEGDRDNHQPWWRSSKGPSTWHDLGSHCFKRTFKYHTLLHYKYRLILKIAPKLKKLNRSVKQLIDDRDFVEEELERFKSLLSKRYLELEERRSNKESAWGDSDTRNLERLRWLAQQDEAGEEREESSSSRSNPPPGRQSTISRWISTGSHTAEHPDREPEQQDFAADTQATRQRHVVELLSDDEDDDFVL